MHDWGLFEWLFAVAVIGGAGLALVAGVGGLLYYAWLFLTGRGREAVRMMKGIGKKKWEHHGPFCPCGSCDAIYDSFSD